MARHFAAGIDIGTSQIRAVIAEEVLVNGHYVPKIIGAGTAESKGLTSGYITNIHEATASIKKAVAQAEKACGIKVRRAFVSIGGIGLASFSATGSIVISRADMEVTNRDMQAALEAAEAAVPTSATLNRKIINTIPVEYRTDGQIAWGRVEGLKAQKLEVKALFITCLEHHLADVIKVVEHADIEVIDVVAAPIAASFVTLSKRQKRAGCLLADIGAETLSIVVFENSTPISLEVFALGGSSITHDIALGLKVSLEEAESIKVGALTRSSFSKKKLDEIVSARLDDMFELIEGHLKRIGRNALLPAGIVLTGGGAHLNNVLEIAEKNLRLPASVGEIHFGEQKETKFKDSTWATACGLAVVGFNAEDEQRSVGLKGTELLAATGKKGLRTLSDWISKFLP